MPRYDYVCEDGHEFELVAGFEDKEVPCQRVGLKTGRVLRKKDLLAPVECGKPAKRQAVYPDQYVAFKGPGFTKTVAPPSSPDLPVTRDEKPDIAKEMLDEFAGTQAEYDDKHRDKKSYETDFN